MINTTSGSLVRLSYMPASSCFCSRKFCGAGTQADEKLIKKHGSIMILTYSPAHQVLEGLGMGPAPCCSQQLSTINNSGLSV